MAVDAVVLAPFGAYPGSCQGVYASDPEHAAEVFGAMTRDKLADYLEKWVHSVGDHSQMLEERLGATKLLELREREVIREGYTA